MDLTPFSGKLAPFPRDKFLTFLGQLKVQSKDLGLVPFQLLGTQRYILDELCRGMDDGISTFYILKSRQIGCTTFCLAVDMYWAFAHKGLLGTFIIHKEEARDDWRQTIDTFYHEIPTRANIDGELMKFRPGLERHNRNLLAFQNGSRFRYMIAGTQENRRGGLGRGTASNYVHGSEIAFYGSEDDIKAFRSSLSSLYPHRLAIWESTGNGFNHWEEAYRAAKDSPAIRRMFVGWWRDERNAFHPEHPLFAAYCPDRKLTRFERVRVNAVKREYDFDISLPQIAWARWKLAEDFENDESTFLQEYSWTDEDSFQATGSKYFTSESLTEAIKAARSSPFTTYRYRLGMRFEETVVVGDIRDLRAELRIWEMASKFGYYTIACDPAYGSSDKADRTVISVWRCYADHLVQVAEFATPQVSTYQCAWVLCHLAGYYGINDVRVILEINGPGAAVFQEMQLLQAKVSEMRPDPTNTALRNIFAHMSHYLYRKVDSLNSELAFHWKTTEDLKRRMMASFKDALELRVVIPRSVALLEECRHIVNDEGHIEAEGGYKDDRVVAAAMAHEAWRMWQAKKLRNMGLTVARAAQIEAQGGEAPLDLHIREFLKRQNIGSQPTTVVQPWQRSW